MRGQLLASNTTVTARALVGTDRCPTDRYLDADSPQFAGACLKFLEISQNLSKWPIPTFQLDLDPLAGFGKINFRS